MELVKGGQLSQYIKEVFDRGEQFSDIAASKIMYGIIDAVSYIHERGIIHRDLKTANILFNEDEGDTAIKIIDFGFGDK